MDWIKKNPAKFALLAVSVIAIAATFLLYQRVSAIDTTFEGMRAGAPSKAKVEKIGTEDLDDAQKKLGAPAMWQPAEAAGSILVSQIYILIDGKLVKPGDKSFNLPVPNAWLTKYELDFLNKAILDEDPDKDGFTTRDEWNGNDATSHLDMNSQPVPGADGQPLPDDSTDPKVATSHPPYHTKLQLAKVVNVPFLLKFMSHDINEKDKKDVTVAINTITAGNRTKYVKVGEDIPGTRFKTVSFEKKEVPGPDGTTKDVSELTIMNTETGQKIILIKGVATDSPDSYGVFRYLWFPVGGQTIPDFPKPRGAGFSLPPEDDKTYKVIDIKGSEAVVELPGGEKKTLKAIE